MSFIQVTRRCIIFFSRSAVRSRQTCTWAILPSDQYETGIIFYSYNVSNVRSSSGFGTAFDNYSKNLGAAIFNVLSHGENKFNY